MSRCFMILNSIVILTEGKFPLGQAICSLFGCSVEKCHYRFVVYHE